MTRDDLWFIQISKDWGWLRRACFVLTWPLCHLWHRRRIAELYWWSYPYAFIYDDDECRIRRRC